MKHWLLGCLGALIVMSFVAKSLAPARQDDGRTPLVWVSDPNPQREEQIAEFNRLHPDLHLRLDPDNSGVMKVVVQSCAGMGPDLIDQINQWNFQTYLDAGILWDITDQAQAMGFGPETLHPTVRQLVMVLDVNTLEYRQFFYPCNVGHTFLIYNRDHFDEAGLPPPSDDMLWDDYVELAKRLTRYPAAGGKVPERFGGAGVNSFLLVWGKGGDLLDPGGTRCLMGTPETVAGVKFLHDLYFLHEVEPTPTQRAGVVSQGGWGGGGTYYTWFGEGRLSMFFGARWMLIQLRRQFHEQMEMQRRWEAANPGKAYDGPRPPRMGAVPVPRFADGQRHTVLGIRGTGINQKSPQREAALRFLQFLAGEEYSEQINRGADAKPGNVAYAILERMRHPDWPDEEDIHRLSIESFEHGRIVPISPFIHAGTMERIYQQALDQVRADPQLDELGIARIMERAAERVDREIKRNLERQPQLRRAYQRLLEQGVVAPATLPLEVAP